MSKRSLAFLLSAVIILAGIPLGGGVLKAFANPMPNEVVLWSHTPSETNKPSDSLLERYAAEGSRPVQVDAEALKTAHYKSRGADLLAGQIWQNPNQKSDPKATSRTLIRHDPDAVARAIMRIYFS